MKRSILSDVYRIALLLGVLLTAPFAQAQVRLGLQAPTLLQPSLTTLQSRQGAQPKPRESLALTDPGPIGLATTTNLFAQVAIGGGYTTVFTFINTGSTTATGNVILTASDGTPMNATISSPAAGIQALNPDVRFFASTASLTVPPGGVQLVSATGPAADNPTNGWARVESEGGSLGGVATFKLVINNALTTIVGVLSAATTSSATIPVNDDGTLAKKRYTGYAVANPGSSDINVKIVLVNPDGTVLQTVTPPPLNPLAPGHQFVRFLFENLGNPNLKFTGSMVMIETSGNPFSVVALALEEGLLTAIPVTPGKAPGIN